MNKRAKCLAALLALCLVAGLAACGSDGDEPLNVGIIQYAPHASLDNCYEGIVQGLEEGGYVDGENISIDFQNAMGETATSDLAAKNMVSSGYDIILAIATPSAMSAYSAAKDADIPVVFSAVSDPVAAGLVMDMDDPQTGATGTSDALNLEGQMAMIRAMLPDAETIGILYTTSEVNSVTHLENFEALAPDYGFEIVSQGVTDASEVATGVATLVAKGVDCINNFTDNNVVNNISVVINACDEAGIPVFGSEEEQVSQYGCVASESLDYIALGIETGLMAASILSGDADVMTLPVGVITDSTPVYSGANLAKFGLTMPDSYSHATDLDE